MNNLSHISFLGIFRKKQRITCLFVAVIFLTRVQGATLRRIAQAGMASHKQVWRDALGGGNILTNNFDHGTPECLPKSLHLQIQERKWFIDHLRNHVGDRYPGASCMKMLASGWTSSNLEEVKETSNMIIFKPWASSFRIFECIGLTWYQFLSRVLEAVQLNPTKHANQSLKQSKRNHDLWSEFFVCLEQH